MSLLNQVLQDLEKRNIETENTSDTFKFNNIKAVSIATNKYSVSLLSLLLICIVLALFAYQYFQPPSSTITPRPIQQPIKKIDDNIKTKALPKTKQQSQATTSKITPKQTTQKKPSQPLIAQKVKTEKITSKTQTSKPKEKTIATPPILSSKQKAARLYIDVKNQPHSIEKVNTLQQIISLNIHHIKARLLLSNTLLQLGLSQQASTLLDQSLILFPQNLQLINLRSQLFLQNKQVKDALVLLQQIDANYINNEIYLSLLAAAYQQDKQHTNSLQIYQRLLNIDSENAKYWLGLAIAQDNMRQNQQAISAYQQALNKNTLQSTIVSYINQRISALK